MSDNESTNKDSIISELVLEDAEFADIVETFVEGLSERLNQMQQALNESDFEQLRVAAHQLKGSGGGYGYPILTERAAGLETMAKAQSLQDCIDALSDLKELSSRIVVGPEA